MSNSEELNLVQDFIYNDEVQNLLTNINNNTMDFNILDITGMGTQEIKHSNILAWLFDDSEHKLEYQILDDFLKKVILKNKENNLKSLQEYLYLSNKKRDITIYREKDNIDLLIIDQANKVVITIENKIYANERTNGKDGGQLEKYKKIINSKFNNNYAKYFIFLTIDLKESSQEDWLTASYQMIANVIENILHTKDVSNKTKLILESYIDLLKRNGIMADKKLEELCEKIWHNTNYRNALEILIANRRTPLYTIFSKLQDIYKIEGTYTNLDREGVKELYKKFNLDYYNEGEIFELQLAYFSGKNERIVLIYWYPDLDHANEELKSICKQIIDKTPIIKKKKKEAQILLIDDKYIENKDIDEVINEIKNKINEADNKIQSIIKEN